MTKDAIKEDANKLRNAVKAKDNDRPIREGLKFLADNGKFKKSDDGIGRELLSKDFLNYEEHKLAQRMLKKYEGVLDPKLYLDILNYKPDKQSQENENDRENQKTLYKTRFTYDGWHYCEFSNNGTLSFLKYRDGQSGIVSSVKIPDPDAEDSEITILPAPQIAQTKRDRALQEDRNEAVKFPPAPIDYESEYALYCEIKAFIHAFMELKPEDEIILALYVMKAAIFDALKDTSFPFIHILAPYGKGKSRLLTVICEITPFGFYSVDIKSAALKRISDLYGAPLFVDEKGQMDYELAAILNGKYNANALVLNANNDIQQGYSAIIGYRIFGPLVLAGRTPFRDDAIESKSFQINMDFDLTRDDVPRKIKGNILDEFTERARNIRGKLLQFRIKWHDRINEINESDFLKPYEKHTEPRLFEVISFFEDLLEIIPELKTEIGRVLKAQILRNVQVAAETPNGIIANEVLTLMDSLEATEKYTVGGKSYTGIYMSAIYEELGKDYAKQTGKILSALGLKTDRPRITKIRKGPNGEPQEYTKQYRMVRIPEEKKINELKSRYDLEFVISNLSAIEQGQQENLFQEFQEFQEKGNPPSKNDTKNDNRTPDFQDGEAKKEEKTIPPFQNDGTLGTHGTELKTEPINSDVQSENAVSAINNHESGNGDQKKDKLKKEERDTQNIQNISTKDPPQHGGLNGLTGLKEVQGVPGVQGVAPHVGYPQNKNETDTDPSNLDVQSNIPQSYRYRVLKDFELSGRMYRAGLEFLFPVELEDEVKRGNLQLVEVRP